MKKFAINIVLLPPDPIMDLALEWNRELGKTRTANLVLNKTDYLPHISLAMGCIFADQLEYANTILQSVASGQHRLELRIPKIKTIDTATGESVVTFDIEPSTELVGFHEAIVAAFSPLLTQNATEEDMYDEPPIEVSTLNWINRYIPDHCFRHFWPHITLGFGIPSGNFTPYSFQVSRLAICHLGNHCTCRNILGEVFLEP